MGLFFGVDLKGTNQLSDQERQKNIAPREKLILWIASAPIVTIVAV
jgi:hypothetical protein